MEEKKIVYNKNGKENKAPQNEYFEETTKENRKT